jgi:bla regulator protein blaR1
MHILNNEIIRALCWTLVHSLWEGFFFAIAAGLVILFTKRSSSVIRYNLLTGLFFLFMLSASFTFIYQFQDTPGKNINQGTGSFTSQLQTDWGLGAKQAGDSEKRFLDIFVNYFDEHALTVVAIWFILFSVQCIRLLANIGYTQRIRYYRTQSPPVFWQHKIKELARRLHIKKHINFLESGIVKVPALIGFLKPIILFPVGLLSQLSVAQVESVLLHELAHIKRRDYFANLLQSFAEVIFFFNPAVLWISSLLREERENCCDDMAIGKTGNKKEFVYALVAFQEYRMGYPKIAIAFPGKKNQLLNRINRIINNKNKTLNSMEKISLAFGILMISVVTIASTQTYRNAPAIKLKQPLTRVVGPKDNLTGKGGGNDTIPAKTTGTLHFTTMVSGKEYRFTLVNDSLTELYINGESIPDEKMSGYRADIDKIVQGLTTLPAKMKLDRELIEMQKSRMDLEEEKMLKEKAEEDALSGKSRDELENLVQLDKQKAEFEQLKFQLDRKQQEIVENQKASGNKDLFQQLKVQKDWLERENQAIQRAQHDLESIQFKLSEDQFNQQNAALEKKAAELKLHEQILNLDEVKLNTDLMQSNLRLNILGNSSPGLIEYLPLSPIAPLQPLKETGPIASIIYDLINEKIIDNGKDLSFMLNNKKFVVNGALQSGDIFLKFKGNYIKHGKDHVIYSVSRGSVHADVYVEDK